MANKIKFYKETTMPSTLTSANDGIYFVKTVEGKFEMTVVNNGIAIPLDAITLATFTTGLAAKYDKPTGSTSQYIRGDGSLATLNKSAVGLSNVDNTSDAAKPVSTATQTALNAKANDSDVVHLAGTETISGTKTFSAAVTAAATPTNVNHLTNKKYVDAADAALQASINDLSNAVSQGMQTPTDLDCSANPNYPVSTKGQTYIVTKAGKIGGASGIVVEIGDMIVCKTTTTTAGTHASVGTNFFIVQTNLSQATESLAGFAKLATAAQVTAGTDDTTIVTPKKLADRLAAFVTSDIESKFVRFDNATQGLTAAQKTNARTNIGAADDTVVVKLSGTQTIAGIKTFSSAPRSSVDATSATDLVRLSQVQTLIQNAEITWSTESWT